jgi:ABC-2 type transport system ATP-binding protein
VVREGVLEVRTLRRRYGEKLAVDGVSFTVKAGECVGLLGPNGAGKTTIVSMIAGLIRPDEGQVRFDGAPFNGDADPRTRELGLVPQELALYDELSARQNLLLFAALYGLKARAAEEALGRALETVGLADRVREPLRNFSGGMKRRLNLAAALLTGPRLLILDEPTVGVDPQSRNAIFENLEVLLKNGMALLYTTHYMEEAERLCQRIVIIDRGRVLADDTLRGIHEKIPARTAIRVELEARSEGVSGPEAVLSGVRKITGVSSVALDGDTLQVTMTGLDIAPAILTWLSANGHRFTHFTSERPSLENVFLTLTGRTLRDA